VPTVERLEDRTLPSTLAPVVTVNPALPPSDSAGGVSQALNSADGRYTVFTSTAPNLVAGQVHTAVVQNVFLYDRQAGTTTLVSHVPGSTLAEADSNSQNPRVSSDGRFVVYESTADNLVAGETGARGLKNVFLYDRLSGDNTLVSHRLGSPTTAAGGNSTTAYTTGFGFSPNATQFLLFTSDAPDLVANEGGPSSLNLFLYDTGGGTTTLVSHSAASPQTGADDNTAFADLTPDGQSVVFQSSADDVVPNQVTDDRDNIFLYSTATGANRLVDGVFTGVGPSTTEAAGFSFRPSISADGSVVSYVSGAMDLVANQAPAAGGEFNNVFLFNALAGTTTLVSGAGGSPSVTANDNSTEAVLSSDGGTVAFISGATDLVAGEGPEQGNVFVYNVATQTLAVASHVQGQPGVAAGAVETADTGTFADLSVSADGSLVCYKSTATDIAPQTDNFGSENILLYNAGSTENTLVSAVAGAPTTGGDRDSLFSHLSADGSAVAFVSFATNLDPGLRIADGGQNVFEYDVAANAGPALASRSASPATATSEVYGTSADGRFVVFTSDAPNLIPGQVDTNADQDVFLLDQATGTVTLVSHVPGSAMTAGNGGSPGTLAGLGRGLGPVISADGNWVAFVSQATDLVLNEDSSGVHGVDQLYLFNRLSGVVTLVSHAAGSSTFVGNDQSDSPALSDDGRFLAFRSRAPDLISGGNTGSFDTPNIYLYDSTTGTTTLVSHDAFSATTGGDRDSAAPTVSDDIGGSCSVAYTSLATTLVSGATGFPSENVFLFRSATETNVLVSHVAGQPTAAPPVSSLEPVISHDGSTVAFVSFATDLVAGQQPGPGSFSNVFLYNVGSAVISLASGAGGSATTPADGYSDSPALDNTGDRVAFRSDAPDLVAGEVKPAGSTGNVFLFGPQAGTTTLVSHAAGLPTTGAAGDSAAPALDGMGDLVVYLSTATDLVPGQQGGGVNNVFVYSTALGANALVSGQGGSPVMPSTSPSYLALVSRDPIVSLNVLSGPGGTSVAFVNKLIQLLLAPNTVAAGSPSGTVVGTVSVDTVFAGQFRPSTFRLAATAGNNALFVLGGTADGTARLFTQFPGSSGGQQTYQVVVDFNIGLGEESAELQVFGPAFGPGPGGGPPALVARLVAVRVGPKGRKKVRLQVEVSDADTGAMVASFLSPFQRPAYRAIAVSVRGGNGAPDEVVLTAKRGKRTRFVVRPV
jgi:hypothetical protein